MDRHYRLIAIAGLAASLALVGSVTAKAAAANGELADALTAFNDISLDLAYERSPTAMDLFSADPYDEPAAYSVGHGKLYFSGVDSRSWVQYPVTDLSFTMAEPVPVRVVPHRLGAREPAPPPYRISTGELLSSTAIDGQHVPLRTAGYDDFQYALIRSVMDHEDRLQVWRG